MATDIKEWCRQCVACCRAKVTHVEHAEVEKIPIPGVQGSMWIWWALYQPAGMGQPTC